MPGFSEVFGIGTQPLKILLTVLKHCITHDEEPRAINI